MADIMDEASELEELQKCVAIQNQLSAPRLEPKIRHGVTMCRHCDEQVPDMALFCPWVSAQKTTNALSVPNG